MDGMSVLLVSSTLLSEKLRAYLDLVLRDGIFILQHFTCTPSDLVTVRWDRAGRTGVYQSLSICPYIALRGDLAFEIRDKFGGGDGYAEFEFRGAFDGTTWH